MKFILSKFNVIL